jgi:V8-like Glu-specific endopeptidase
MKYYEKLSVLAVGFILVLGMITPGTAITHGELDGEGHPEVILILMEVDGEPAYRCSGTLISPTFVLTAGHCAGAAGEFSGLRIFTESDVDNGNNNYPYGGGKNSIEVKNWASHPLYTDATWVYHDVGMLELKKPLRLKTYGQLPTEDQLESLHGGSQDAWFTAVGYGLQKATAAWSISNRVRMYATPFLLQINTGLTGDFSILLSNNANTGGTCFGDSGGPNYVEDSRVVAGVTSYGLNYACGGTGGVFRVDQGNVLDFIYAFMDDPYTR